MESVYTDVIEGYTIATIKLLGWFFFGSFLIIKGAVVQVTIILIIFFIKTILQGMVDAGGRSLEGRSLTESVTGIKEEEGGAVNYTIPLMKVPTF